MRALLRLTLIVVAGCVGACAPSTGSRPAPASVASAVEVAQSIFDQITRLHIEGLPDDREMEALAPLLSDDLRQRMDAARAWQHAEIERMQREGSEDKPPFIEGDLFSSLFEGAQTAHAVAANPRGDRIVVAVDRVYVDGDDRVQWQDRAILVQVGDGYRLDDIEYGGEWAFQAGSSTLRETLKARE